MHDKQARNNELCTARRDPIDSRIEHISSHTVMLLRYSDGIQDGTLLVTHADVVCIKGDIKRRATTKPIRRCMCVCGCVCGGGACVCMCVCVRVCVCV